MSEEYINVTKENDEISANQSPNQETKPTTTVETEMIEVKTGDEKEKEKETEKKTTVEEQPIDDEKVQLVTSSDDKQTTENDAAVNEAKIKQKMTGSKKSSQTKRGIKTKTSQKMICGPLMILCCCAGIIILIIFLSTATYDEDGKNVTDDIDIEDWSYNMLLSDDIDSTGLKHGILYKQLSLSTQNSGINRINFDRNYTYNGPIGYTKTWLNAQSRTVYNYALAYENTKDETFLNYAVNGMKAIFNDFYDEMYGGYFRSIIKYENGTRFVVESVKDSYQHEFLIKALSKLYEVTLNETYLNEATNVYNMLWDKFTDATGVGLEQKLTRNFENATEQWKSSDPMLHFFHSSLKLYVAYLKYYDYDTNETDSNVMLSFMEDKINKIYDFLMDIRVNVSKPETDQMYDVICVYYDNNWKPKSLDWPLIDNINIGQGMQFALFIWKFMDLGVIDRDIEENIQNANEFFDYSIGLAFNESDGALDYLYGANAPEWQWWQQSQWWIGAESIRTIVYYNTNYDTLQLDQVFQWYAIRYTKEFLQTLQNKVVQWYNKMYYDTKYGGIYAVPQEQVYDKGYELKVGYHTIESSFDILNTVKSNKLTKI